MTEVHMTKYGNDGQPTGQKWCSLAEADTLARQGWHRGEQRDGDTPEVEDTGATGGELETASARFHDGMTKADLQAAAEAAGLDASGTKADLVARLNG